MKELELKQTIEERILRTVRFWLSLRRSLGFELALQKEFLKRILRSGWNWKVWAEFFLMERIRGVRKLIIPFFGPPEMAVGCLHPWDWVFPAIIKRQKKGALGFEHGTSSKNACELPTELDHNFDLIPDFNFNISCLVQASHQFYYSRVHLRL